jgi:exopolysaccharide biosynthesis polyprenyl glycosylphosphotransferase
VGVESAVDVAVRHQADAMLVLPGNELTPTLARRLEWDAASRQVDVYLSTSLLDVAPSRTSVLRAGGMAVLHVRPVPVYGPYRIAKSVAERALAALALILLLPALVAIAIAVRRDSPGHALFHQDRVGRAGRLFTMYKFRTMGCSAEQEVAELADRNDADGVLFKLRDDPRVTRIGAILRRYSIDELPQLWNVVKGEMSLVGPRPALPHEVARYDLDPRRRLAVKPGLTGLWQVSGRSDLTWEESVRLDIQYVDNWSPALDLTILGRTLRAVVGQRGAY